MVSTPEPSLPKVSIELLPRFIGLEVWKTPENARCFSDDGETAVGFVRSYLQQGRRSD
jgi:hypothetical protein